MRKLTDFIIEKRNFILCIFLLLASICLYTSTKVNINTDITKYLPSTSETKQGVSIMEDTFKDPEESTLNVVFKDVKEEEKESLKEELASIENVFSVSYENTEEYNQGKYTLYILEVKEYADSTISKDIYETVRKEYKPFAMSGSIDEYNKPVLELWILIVAVSLALLILILTSDSYTEPFLYLFSIGVAIFINKGTNIFFSSVSNITDSITAILQLALSMDYSIMLSNRYRQEKANEKDKIKAMKSALYHSFKSISSSSITTIVGLLALVFMSFTIGKDLGFVLAKGVLLSLVCIFSCLPALLLLFDSLIEKTHKKALPLKLTKVGKFSYATRYIQPFIILIAFVGSFLLKGNLGILYTTSEQDEVGKIFPATNQMAIIYKEEYENLISSYCKTLEANEHIDQVLCYGNTINEKLAYNELNEKFSSLGQDVALEEYLIKLIYYNYYNPEDNNKMSLDSFLSFIKSDIYKEEQLKNKIDAETKENIALLENFTNKNLLQKERTSKEIASLLNVKEEEIEKILLLYNGKYAKTTLSMEEFISVIEKEVLSNPEYSALLDKETKSSLRQLKNFTNKNNLTKKMAEEEIALLYGLDKKMVEQLFLYYEMKKEPTQTLSLNAFANFTLSLSEQDNFKDQFLPYKETIVLLEKISNKELLNTKMNYQEMALFLNMPEEKTSAIYTLYQTENKIKENETLVAFLEYIKNKVEYIDKDEVIHFLLKEINTQDKIEFTIEDLKNNKEIQLLGIDNRAIEKIYQEANKDTLTKEEILSLLEELISTSIENSNPEEIITFIESILKETSISLEEIKKLFPQEKIKNLYQKYIEELNKVEVTPIECITFSNEYKPFLESILSKEELTNLQIATSIMNHANNTFTYQELYVYFNIILEPESISKSTLMKIYSLYAYHLNTRRMTLSEFTSFLLESKNDSMLEGKLEPSSLDKLSIVNKVINKTLANEKYTVEEIASLFKIEKERVKLVYGIYETKYEKDTISFEKLIPFLKEEVLTDSTYNHLFDEEMPKRINGIYGIILASEKNTLFNVPEMVSILNTVTEQVDEKEISLVYMYNGSVKHFDSSWKLTIEEFVNHINNAILTDSRFNDFIEKEMRTKCEEAIKSINNAKDMLFKDGSGRVVLNTKYAAENKETFAFIESIKEQLKDKEGIYIVGDSPMALEISQSFGKELDFITILTIVFIFVIVAITFKSFILPLILVLIIQTAVYFTMGVLSLLGGNVYFIALLIVQAILMGATIDYAIVYTSYYKELRIELPVKESIIKSYNLSIHTIFTSSSILIIVTSVIAQFASAIAAKICETLSQGTICAVILILFTLPGMLATFDKIICKDGYQEKK